MMMILAPLCLTFCWMLPVCSKMISVKVNLKEIDSAIKMDMVKDAVDDMYFNCRQEMTKRINEKLFEEENTGEFAKSWKEAQKCAKEKFGRKDKADKALTLDHLQAICAYTSGKSNLYPLFNAAVRTNRSVYTDSFKFHSIHFWLTSALQILNNNKECHTTYRRTNVKFIGKVNQMIRFGFFASSSYNPKLTDFGKKTCFKITTCYGAFLKKYPTLKDKEQEVLIPPYEMFEIKEKPKKFRVEGLADCEDVYVLESVGVYSNLNCKAAK